MKVLMDTRIFNKASPMENTLTEHELSVNVADASGRSLPYTSGKFSWASHWKTSTRETGSSHQTTLEEKNSMQNNMMDGHTITIPATYDVSLPYLFGRKEEYFDLVMPLYEASITGDWETAKLIFNKRPDMVRYGLSKNLGTTLHVAVTAKETKQTLNFVKNLVNMMTMEELELKNIHGNTAFYIASIFGQMKMAMIMMEKNSNLVDIRGNIVQLPLAAAAMDGTHNIVKWLYGKSHKMTGDHWTDDDKYFTLWDCVNRDYFDVALQIIEDHPELARNHVSQLLQILARKPDALNRVEKNLITKIIKPSCRLFNEEDTDALKLLKLIWGHAKRTMNVDEIVIMLRERHVSLPDGKMQHSSGMLFTAAERGNTRFIVEVLRTYPDLMLDINQDNVTVFHVAVMHRHQGIYNLLYEIGTSSHDVCLHWDTVGNNMLHLVGKTSKEMVAKTSRASLLMQRELLWFMEVRKIMPPSMIEEENKDGLTAYDLFYKENQEQVSNGLKWMKDCMVVSTLIVTVAFATAFTVPGGYNQEHGLPIFIHQHAFLLFVIADAISLFSSSTSLLVFLTILTSRQEQRDFMYSLPRKLMIGLLSLFISIAAMMVTFSAGFFVLYHRRLKWVPIVIATLAVVPVLVFAVLQLPLLMDMFRSMYDSHYLFKAKKHMLYATNPRNCSKNSSCWRILYESINTRIILKRS